VPLRQPIGEDKAFFIGFVVFLILYLFGMRRFRVLYFVVLHFGLQLLAVLKDSTLLPWTVFGGLPYGRNLSQTNVQRVLYLA